MSNPLITEEYRALNRQLHEERPDFGAWGHKSAGPVRQVIEGSRPETILDYGCGKQTLQQAIPEVFIKGYDPAILGLDAPPEPADFVVCGDVLEHIEPECLEAVLDDLKRVTKKVAIFIVATQPSKKTLANGQNAHLIQEPVEWWLPKIRARFVIDHFGGNEGEFMCILAAKP